MSAKRSIVPRSLLNAFHCYILYKYVLLCNSCVNELFNYKYRVKWRLPEMHLYSIDLYLNICAHSFPIGGFEAGT